MEEVLIGSVIPSYDKRQDKNFNPSTFGGNLNSQARVRLGILSHTKRAKQCEPLGATSSSLKNGSTFSLGEDYVVLYIITVHLIPSDDPSTHVKWELERRFSHFKGLYEDLVSWINLQPNISRDCIPPLPSKWSTFRPSGIFMSRQQRVDAMEKIILGRCSDLHRWIIDVLSIDPGQALDGGRMWHHPSLRSFLETDIFDSISLASRMAETFTFPSQRYNTDFNTLRMQPSHLRALSKGLRTGMHELAITDEQVSRVTSMYERIYVCRTLIVTADSSLVQSAQLVFDLSPFKNLQSIDISDVPVHCVRGLYPITTKLRSAKITKGEITTFKCAFRDTIVAIDGSNTERPASKVWGVLKLVNLQCNKLKSLEGAADFFPNVEILDVTDNEIMDISDIKYLNNLNRLILAGNTINSLEGLNYSGNLVQLDISRNKLTSLTGLERAFSLVALNLGYNLISEINEVNRLRDLPFLEFLTLAGNPFCYSRNYRSNILARMKGISNTFTLDNEKVFPLEKLRNNEDIVIRKRSRYSMGTTTPAKISDALLNLKNNDETSNIRKIKSKDRKRQKKKKTRKKHQSIEDLEIQSTNKANTDEPTETQILSDKSNISRSITSAFVCTLLARERAPSKPDIHEQTSYNNSQIEELLEDVQLVGTDLCAGCFAQRLLFFDAKSENTNIDKEYDEVVLNCFKNDMTIVEKRLATGEKSRIFSIGCLTDTKMYKQQCNFIIDLEFKESNEDMCKSQKFAYLLKRRNEAAHLFSIIRDLMISHTKTLVLKNKNAFDSEPEALEIEGDDTDESMIVRFISNLDLQSEETRVISLVGEMADSEEQKLSPIKVGFNGNDWCVEHHTIREVRHNLDHITCHCFVTNCVKYIGKDKADGGLDRKTPEFICYLFVSASGIRICCEDEYKDQRTLQCLLSHSLTNDVEIIVGLFEQQFSLDFGGEEFFYTLLTRDEDLTNCFVKVVEHFAENSDSIMPLLSYAAMAEDAYDVLNSDISSTLQMAVMSAIGEAANSGASTEEVNELTTWALQELEDVRNIEFLLYLLVGVQDKGKDDILASGIMLTTSHIILCWEDHIRWPYPRSVQYDSYPPRYNVTSLYRLDELLEIVYDSECLTEPLTLKFSPRGAGSLWSSTIKLHIENESRRTKLVDQLSKLCLGMHKNNLIVSDIFMKNKADKRLSESQERPEIDRFWFESHLAIKSKDGEREEYLFSGQCLYQRYGKGSNANEIPCRVFVGGHSLHIVSEDDGDVLADHDAQERRIALIRFDDILEISVGMFDQWLRCDAGSDCTFTLITRNADLTGALMGKISEALNKHFDSSTSYRYADIDRCGMTEYTFPNSEIAIVFPGDASIRNLEKLLGHDVETCGNFDVLFYAMIHCSHDSNSNKFVPRTFIATTHYFYLCLEDLVHWPLQKRSMDVPDGPQYIVKDSKPSKELSSVEYLSPSGSGILKVNFNTLEEESSWYLKSENIQFSHLSGFLEMCIASQEHF